MKCDLCGIKTGLMLKIELYKDDVKFDAGIIGNDTVIICKNCVFKMIYNEIDEKQKGQLEEFIANLFGETLHP